MHLWQLLMLEKLACLSDRNSFNEVTNRRPPNCIGPRGCNSSRNCIPPSREQFSTGSRPFAKYHSNPNINAQGAKELGCRSQPKFTPADVQHPGDHGKLNCRENRKICERDW